MTDTNNKLSLEELKSLMAQFSASELKQAVKTVKTVKPTLLSLTMDAILAAGLRGAVITDDVTKDVTSRARDAGVIKTDESATQSSVAALIRYVSAYDAALGRAGYEVAKKAAPEPVGEGQPSDQPNDTASDNSVSSEPTSAVVPMPKGKGASHRNAA